MSEYGDYEPEDAWHPDDELHVLLDNLARRARALFDTVARARRLQLDLTARDELRARQLIDDLDHVRRTST